MDHYKYPRTPHLPYSESITDDDKVLSSDAHFYKMNNVVVTVKMDGENTTVYSDGYCHARSVDSMHKQYHSWLLRNINNWCYSLPQDYHVCGEYLYATHSIKYDSLESYFQVFSIWDKEECLSWEDTVKLCKTLNLIHVPILYEGKYDEKIIQNLAETEIQKNGQEGLVVRNADSYNIKDMAENIAKYVRKNHVQTDQHWSQGKIEINGLKI